MFFLQPSQKRLLNSLNPLFFAGAVFVAVLLRTGVGPAVPSLFRLWDVLLPFVVYFGQRRNLAEGVVLTLFTGHLYSLCSSAPIGVFALHYLVLFLAARLLSYGVLATSWVSVLSVMFVLTIFARLSLTAIAAFFGHPWPFFSSVNLSVSAIAFNAVVGFWVFGLLGALDRATYKVEKINIELSEDGL